MYEPIVWIAIEMAFAGMSVVAMCLFVRAFLKDEREIHIAWKILVLVVCFAGRFISNYFVNDSIWVISGVTIANVLLIGIVCFRAKFFAIVLTLFFFMIVAAITELVSAFMLSVFRPVAVSAFMQHSVYRMYGVTLSYLLKLVLIALIGRIRSGRMNILDFRMTMIFCTLPFISMFIAFQFTMHVITSEHTPTVSDATTLFSIIFVNMLIFLLVESLVRQNEKNRLLILLESQNKAQQSHIRQLMDNQMQIRKMSHDFKLRVSALLALSNAKKYNELSSYLAELAGNRSEAFCIDTGCIMLDAILSSKKSEAEVNGIDFRLHMDVSPEIPDINMDISTLLGNGLDNAIESCMRAEENNRLIEVTVNANSSQFMCRIRNTLGSIPEPDGMFFKSSKSNRVNHGVGLKSMRQTCDALGGILDIDYDDKYFECQVYLPMQSSAEKFIPILPENVQ